MRIIVFMFLFIFSLCKFSFAQEVLANGGGAINNGVLSMDYTIGEAVTLSLSTSNRQLNSGFIQPNYIITKINNYVSDFIKVFPNPTNNFLNIDINKETNFSYKLLDIYGKNILDGNIHKSTTINSHSLSNGVYFLLLVNPKENKSYSYRIIKQ